MTKHQISISNNDISYLKPIIGWCDKYNLTTKIYKRENVNSVGWISQDIRIYNTVLCKILSNLCGNLSHNKYVSPNIVFSNRECIMGFLDAYIGGDGSIIRNNRNKNNEYRCTGIQVSSVSYNLLLDVQIMLKNLGIIGNIHKLKKATKNNRGTLPENIKQTYNLTIVNQQGKRLANLLNIKVEEKQNRCKQIITNDFKYEYSREDLKIPNIINGKLIMEPRKNQCPDLMFDEVISIEEMPNTTKYAYDLTVEETRNFDFMNGVCGRDTFHLAGVASKSNVTRGVPRIEELLRLTKNPKNPSLTIHLKPLDETEKDRAISYANMIEYTKLIDVVKSIKILFDPNDNTSFIEEDRLLIKQFYEFENILKECAGYKQEDPEAPNKKSKWVIRMEMDPEILLDKNITMDDINYAIKNSSYGENIDCVFSDYNSDKLIFRIRLTNDDAKKKKISVANTLDQSDEIYMLKNLQTAILNGIVLRGVNKIEKVIPRKLQNMVVFEEGKYVRKDLWVLDTKGTNLLNILGLEFIDTKRTYSNDVREVCDILGIEAARQMLFNELTEVMEFADAFINYHHLSLLCDRMTMTKDMVPIFRSGILSDDIGPIAKATFEVHTEVLLDAARHADFDHMRGVSSSVMCGQYGNYGTGAFQLVLDMNQMRNLTDAAVETEIDDITQEIASKFKIRASQKADSCGKKELEIQNNIINIKRPEVMDICPDDEYDMGF